MDSRFRALFQNIPDNLRRIGNWFRVCHTNHRRKAARLRSRRARLDVLLVGQTRIAEMHMDVHQSRCDDQPFCVQHLGICRDGRCVRCRI